MIDLQEYVFVVDRNNLPLQPQLRSFSHTNKLWHRTSGIWVINNQKQVLCQKRSLRKDVNPGMWEAFFGGHLAPQEDYRHNAAQEVGEELGIQVSEDSLIPYNTLKSDKPNHREFQGIFALILLYKAQDFAFEKEEIDELKWKTVEELMDILVKRQDESWIKKPWDKEVLEWLPTL